MSLLFLFSFMNILNFLKYLLIFIVVLTLIVGIHEFGHFLFARKAGILCREYAIGMGPKLFSKRKGETVYSVRAFPIGGFCAIAGEELEEDPFKGKTEIKLDIVDGVIKGFYFDIDDDKVNYPKFTIVSYDIVDMEQTGELYMEVVEQSGEGEELTVRYPVDPKAMMYEKKQEMQIAPFNRQLGSKNKRQRGLVMFGGPLMNFLLALVIFFIVGLFSGFANTKSSKIGEVSEGSNAFEVLQSGDVVKKMRTESLELKEINSWNDLSEFMSNYSNSYLMEKIILTVDRNGEEVEVTVAPLIAINSAGIGTPNDYMEDENKNVAKIGVYQEMKSGKLVDNSGLKVGDIITSIKTKELGVINNPTWMQVKKAFDDYTGDYENKDDKYITLTVKRLKENSETEYEEKELRILPYSDYVLKNQTSINGSVVPPTSTAIGISCTTKFSLLKSFGYSFERFWGSLVAVWNTLKLLFTGAVSIKNLSGPIGIFSITKQASQYGVLYVMSLVGLLSVNIGALNLLPIPALDGGRLVFLAYEAITRKKPSQKVETILITVTMILLLGLMVFVAFSDIMRLIH